MERFIVSSVELAAAARPALLSSSWRSLARRNVAPPTAPWLLAAGDAPVPPASGDPVGVRAFSCALRLLPLPLRPALTGLSHSSSISLASTPMHSCPLLHPSQNPQAKIPSANE
eukprot:2192206-Rhodomonas_salina.1